MINFDTLTTDELEYICGQIPLSSSRQYFQKNPKYFAEIKPGFRPERLSDADTFSLLSRNVKKHFIASFLEKKVSQWLEEIQANRNRLADEGYSEEEALLLTIPDSVFCNKCELYFKLIESSPNDDYIRLFREALSLRQKEKDARITETQLGQVQSGEELLEKANKTIADLKEQLNQCKNAESSLTERLDSVNRQVIDQKEELNGLKSALAEGEAAKSDMQAELEHYRRLASFSDEYIQDDASEYQHISIGQIYHSFNGKIWINRLADIINGEIVPFVLDESAPRFFSNRDRLFWQDGPDEDDVIGVWSWSADPNYSDSTKDYVTSEYSRNLKVTEIVELPHCKSLSEVSSFLTNWFQKNFFGEKILFVCTTASGTMEGVLCSADNMEIFGDKTRLQGSVFMLPHYTVKPSDIVKIGGLRIFRKMSLGIPQSVFRVRTPYDVVKKMLLSRVTIPALRENELTKKEAQKCKHFLEGIPTETLIQGLSDAYACTEAEAKAYVDGFIDHASTYLSEDDFDIKIVSLALERNAGLVELCKKLLSEEWQRENSDRIGEAERQLADTKQAEKSIRQETEALLQKKESLTDEFQATQQKIEDANQLALDVEKKVAQRIKDAQQDAAEFVSQMAFVSSFFSSSKNSEVPRNNSSVSVFKSVMCHTDSGIVDDFDTFEEELTENLTVIGYKDEFAVEIAQAISFCICNRLPILLGENATALAKCVAATIGGEELTEVFVGGQSTVIGSLYELMEGKRANYPLVYLVHGVFDGYSNNLFNEISNLTRNTSLNTVVFLSLQGISPNLIINNVWSEAFYVDGDSGIERISDGPVKAVNPVMEFAREIDTHEYEATRKELRPFSSVLSNMQICLYARYLATYGISLRQSPTILNQLIAVSRSSGLEEQLNALFHENGVTDGEKMIEQYL